MALQKFAAQFVVCGGALYRKAHLGPNQLCVTTEESQKVMEEIHEGICGPHMSGATMVKNILHQGYYWTTMEADCVNYHDIPLAILHLGNRCYWEYKSKREIQASFILVAIDYFTKWVEAASYATLKATHMAKFISTNIIYRYSVPHEFICDYGSHFKGATKKLFAEFGIQNHRSSTYRPQTNGTVEAANKNIKRILWKIIDIYTNWPEILPLALWGYRTTERTSTEATPYSLVYGMEVVLPVKLELTSLRVLAETEMIEEDWVQNRYDELTLLDERRLRALYHVQGYQHRIARAFNKKVKPRDIKVGDMVLKAICRHISDLKGMFKPNWGGPYFVKRILS
ncbi:uncharacterized protein LOC131299699 [Rhododendron vialii]|uniref:uncharacterized protein LOC131299699 n=1 Tax=Rhododendron vialii TaxID=182163 RepID=UPI00265D8705|nr:uncharacterized protein LOC131299699 [Rhododendron vialii]